MRTGPDLDKRGRERRGDLVYREPRAHDCDAEQRVLDELRHLLESTDLWNLRTTQLAAIIDYFKEATARKPHWTHWAPMQDAIARLAIGVEHYRG